MKPHTPLSIRLRLWLGRFQAQRRRRRIWQGLLVLALGIALAIGLWSWFGAATSNPLLQTPIAALAEVKSKSLYYNGPAWEWLRRERPDLLRQEDRASNSNRVRSFAQAVQNPKLFRQLDRQERFSELLLVGAPSQYRPLLDHLLETRDWSLAYVDHTSLLFRRGEAAKWDVSQLSKLQEQFRRSSQHDQAIFLAETASKLIAVREFAPARLLLEQAEALGARVPEVPSVHAQYHLARGEWREAIASADAALGLAKGDLSALGSKAQALYSTKRFNEAYAISQQLVDRLQDDPAMLFYHAKIAHEARAFVDEAKALRRLIALAEQNDRPVSGYRVYLGQSLATAGEGPAALAQFKLALADPELPAAQREFAQDCLKLIQSQGKP